MNLIIDANNLAHRARHAYHLSFRGHDTSVTYGVMRMLVALIKKFEPSSVILCWDGGTPGFRKRHVPAYKAARKEKKKDPTWNEFITQLCELERILPHTGVLQVKRTGIEADDLMAHASRLVVGKALIVTTDDDLLQCVSRNVNVYSPIRDVMYTHANFVELIGYPVHQHVKAKVLQGDSSDGIEGVRGVGPKTVLKLLAGRACDIPESTQARLQEFLDSGKYMASYVTVDLSNDMVGAKYTILNTRWQPYNKSVMMWCVKRGFTSLVEAAPLGAVFGKLGQPKFKGDLHVTPRIWDYKRYPVG